MTGQDLILLIDDDAQVRDGLAMLLERPGRTTIVCSDVESAEFVLAHYEVTHVLTDVQFSGTFGFEGLHFIARIRKLRPDCRIVLMTGNATPALRGAAVELGAAVCLQKPFSAEQLEAAMQLRVARAEGDYVLLRCPAIDEVIETGVLTAVYQPIVRLGEDRGVIAFEALARVAGAWARGGPAELFDYGERCSRLPELNRAALERAIAGARHLPGDARIFLNVDPATFDGGGLVSSLRRASERHGVALSRLVLEITERSCFSPQKSALRAIEELRDLGVAFALDDHGSAYSHLGAIDAIRPSFFKISATFGTGFEKDDARTRIVRHIVALARDFGCRTILEGVESAETADAAAALGIELAQGFYFGRPAVASRWSEGLKAQTSGATLFAAPHASSAAAAAAASDPAG